MDQLIEYRRLVRVLCTAAPHAHSQDYTFQVKLEQLKPHSIFKYDVVKHAQEVIQLYAELERDIFDFGNPFSLSFLKGLTRPDQSHLQVINQSLANSQQRIDVLTHPRFVGFFCLQLHYPDFVESLREEDMGEFKRELGDVREEAKKEEEKREKEEGNMYCTDRPWMKSKEFKQEVRKDKAQLKQSPKTLKTEGKETAFDRMTKLCRQEQSWQLQTEESSVIDYAHLPHPTGDLIFLLEQRKSTAKITNFLKTFFNQQQICGYLSIHKKWKGKYSRTMVAELQAQPLSLKLQRRSSMLMVLTGVGVYIYLAQMEKNYEQAELFGYVEMPGLCDFAVNPALGELYLLRNVPPELHAHSINKERTMKTQFKFNGPTAICFEEHHSRLYVCEETALNVYNVKESLEIKKLHVIALEGVFDRLIESHSYLYALSSKGLMAVIELKPPQKEKLMSVLTRIELPSQTTNLTASLTNRRLLITNYANCLVLIDSMEGPLQSLRLREGSGLVKVGVDGEGRVMGVSGEGWVSVVRLNEHIA